MSVPRDLPPEYLPLWRTLIARGGPYADPVPTTPREPAAGILDRVERGDVGVDCRQRLLADGELDHLVRRIRLRRLLGREETR